MNVIFNQSGLDSQYKIWHTNGEYMLMYVHSGSGSIVTVEQNHPFFSGCLCFIGADKFHYTIPDDPNCYERSKLFVSRNTLNKIFSLFPEDQHVQNTITSDSLVVTQIHPANQDRIISLFDDVRQNLYNQAVFRSLYMRLMVYITEYPKSAAPNSPLPVQSAVEYINRHISENIQIEAICEAVHMSKYYFCRKFKALTGYTVMDYISRTRVVAAQNILRNQTISVTEVSEQCGFSSVSYFCRIFKEQTGKTPLQYRKECNYKSSAYNL